MKITRQKGTYDIYGKESRLWQYIESNIRQICDSYNVSEIRTPVFEATELYQRGVGDETDIVNKEMYTFIDKGGRSITLRPELTAGVVRAYIENGMGSLESPLKFWYTSNMYRYEKMQKGRYREFTQFGVEIFGSSSYLADIETIKISNELFKSLNLRDKLELTINSIGCKECRKEYINKLREFVKPNLDKMCDTCKTRFEKNPMRMLDCKEENCKQILKDAPIITDCLCDTCKEEFEKVKYALDALNISYVVDTSIVRGLDYYNNTVYEWTSKDLGLAVGGGGRYDGLVEVLGGTSTPAVGFGIGVNRVAMLLTEYGLTDNINQDVDFGVITLDEEAAFKISKVADDLRKQGYRVDQNITSRNFKAQLKYTDKIRAKYVIIIGEDEVKKEICLLKNMSDGSQKECKLDAKDIIKNM